MSPWLRDRLYDAFPDLYAEHTLPMQQTAMCWGFSCGDGWFGLVWELSGDLNKLIQREPAAERASYRAVQVKEKFGGLRFYMRASTPTIDARIARAEAESFCTCDVCSKPGALSKGGRWQTRCAEHDNAQVAPGYGD